MLKLYEYNFNINLYKYSNLLEYLNMDAKKISIKDPVTKELYDIRLNIFKNTKKTYQLQKDLFRLTIIDANMKRVHLNSMIPQIDHLIDLQNDQINQVYSSDREKEINILAKKVNGGDWTDDEKRILLSRSSDLSKLQIQISTLMMKIEADGKQLTKYQGTEITGVFKGVSRDAL